jgi:hypothetical protein
MNHQFHLSLFVFRFLSAFRSRRPRVVLYALLVWAFALSGPALSAAPLESAREVVSKFIQTHGTREGWNRVNSMRWLGTLKQEGREFEIVLARKRPNLLRFGLRQDRARLEFGFDGEHAWQTHNVNEQTVHAALVKNLQRERIERESRFGWPYFMLMDLSTRSELMGTEEVAGRTAYVLSVRTDLLKGLQVLLDTETFHVVKTVSLEEGETAADEDDTLIEDYYSEPKEIMVKVGRGEVAIPFPTRMRTVVNGEDENVVNWERIDVNVGLFDSYFQLPDEVEEAAASAEEAGESGT